MKLAGKPSGLRQHTPNLPAYEAFLKGRHHLFRFTPESWAKAEQCFRHATELDPKFGAPHGELGLSYILVGTNGLRSSRELAPRVLVEARKALELNPSELGPHALLGTLAAANDYDWKEAYEQFQTAMAATSVSADTRWAYASFYLQALGRFHESVAEMRRAVDQDPLNVSWRAVLASHLSHAGMYGEALEEARSALALDENNWLPHYMIAEAFLGMERFPEVVVEAEEAHRMAPWNSMATGTLAGALTRIGEKGRAEQLITEMGEAPLPVWGRVLYHLICSDLANSAKWYERMIEERDPFAVLFNQAPITRALRQSSHWPMLARRMNLPSGL